MPHFPRPSPAILVILGSSFMLTAIGIESLVAFAIVLMEGTIAFAALGSAALAGLWVLHLFGLARIPWPQRIIFAAALGIGSLPLVVLGLGSAGVLTRPLAITLILLLAAVGVVHLRDLAGRVRRLNESYIPHFNWLWLAIVPFFIIMLLAASLPPGVLWKEEGFGYDVLEYHLAVPKAFYEQHKIAFLPGNVYSNFPLNSEMLSLLMMVLRGDSIEAAFMATLVNVAFAALFVASAWSAGRCFSSLSALIAAVLGGTTGWLTYLSGIAFVEPGMLAMGMAAFAAMLHAGRDPQNRLRWMLLAGVLAGLACGFKYTAVPMIAMPLVIYPLSSGPWIQRLKNTALYALAALAAFSPWLIRNTINTHNPVFPMAYSVFGAKEGLWTPEQQTRWHNAHSLAGGERTGTPVYIRVWERIFAEPRMGFALFILAACGLAVTFDRHALTFFAIWIWQFAFWLLATHLFARFAVVMLLPLIPLAARCIPPSPFQRWFIPLIIAALLAGISCNLYHIWGLYYDHTRAGGLSAYGRTDWFTDGQWPGTKHWAAVNRLPAGSKVMLVGEARSFYIRTNHESATVFDRHSLSEVVGAKSESQVLQWLRERGVTHLLVHWNEMQRLSATYGFDDRLDAPFFSRLQAAGLKTIESFALWEGRPPYATLYEVPAHE